MRRNIVFWGKLTHRLTCPFFMERKTIMKREFFDEMLLYFYGDECLYRTIGNLIWGGQYVPNEQVRKQMLSLSSRLSDNMDPVKWPEYLRRIRSNMIVRIQCEQDAEQENLAFMRAELKKMEAENEGKTD